MMTGAVIVLLEFISETRNFGKNQKMLGRVTRLGKCGAKISLFMQHDELLQLRHIFLKNQSFVFHEWQGLKIVTKIAWLQRKQSSISSSDRWLFFALWTRNPEMDLLVTL